jgi:hypothetical protein
MCLEEGQDTSQEGWQPEPFSKEIRFMRPQQRLCARSILRTSIAAMAVIAGSLAAPGCGNSPQTAPARGTDITANHVIITDRNDLSGLAWRTVEYQRTAQGEKIIAPGQDWTQTAPGVWTNKAQGITTTLKIEPVEDAAETGLLESTICHFAHYIGPSSAADPTLVGEASIAQLDCTKGKAKAYFIVGACSDLVPDCEYDDNDGYGYASPGSPYTLGVAVPGTAGADCSGSVWYWGSYSGFNPCG